MIDKLKHLHTALLHLPCIPDTSRANLKSPHWAVDWHTSRNIDTIGLRYNINTVTTTLLEPKNRGKKPGQKVYHVFRLPGDRPRHANTGKKRPYVARPRPQVQVVATIPKEYRRHCGGH